MTLEEYNTLQKQENSNVVAIDFDGVIHKSSKGFYDGTIYDDPVENSIDSIKYLYEKGFKIIVYTCKAKQDRPLVNDRTGAYLVWEWLNKHKIGRYVSEVTSEKPRALLYIDDKGYKFNNWKETIEYISNL